MEISVTEAKLNKTRSIKSNLQSELAGLEKQEDAIKRELGSVLASGGDGKQLTNDLAICTARLAGVREGLERCALEERQLAQAVADYYAAQHFGEIEREVGAISEQMLELRETLGENGLKGRLDSLLARIAAINTSELGQGDLHMKLDSFQHLLVMLSQGIWPAWLEMETGRFLPQMVRKPKNVREGVNHRPGFGIVF